MHFGLFLLFLLVVSIVLGIIRILRGGPFLPVPAPGDDRNVVDNNGRWWRQSEDGTFEEAFRRQTGAPLVARSILVGTVRFYFQLLLWLAIPAATFVGLWMVSAAAAEVGIPGWLSWVGGAVAYLLILRFGRKRGWFYRSAKHQLGGLEKVQVTRGQIMRTLAQ